MLNRPEELIMAILAGLWVVLTYFVCAYLGMPTDTRLAITLLTLIWGIVFFLLWQRGQTRRIWPIFLGLLVACWWPMFNWISYKDLIAPGNESSTVIINLPWYATWTAKFIYSFIPIIAGYAWKIKRYYNNKKSAATPTAEVNQPKKSA